MCGELGLNERLKRYGLILISLLLWLVGSYFVAGWLAEAWVPERLGWVVWLTAVSLLITPLIYYRFTKKWHYTRDTPHFLHPTDTLLPLWLYPSLLFLFLLLLPRYLMWEYGAVAGGEVVAVAEQERLDFELMPITVTCVGYDYRVVGKSYSGETCTNLRQVESVMVGQEMAVYYFPQFPNRSTIGLPILFGLPDQLLIWWLLVIVVWLGGTAVISPRRYPPPPLPPPNTPLERLERYGLHTLLTAGDDPALWGAVVETFFLLPDNPKINVAGLRFGVGELNQASSFLLQPVLGTCFERQDRDFLCLADYQPDEKGDHEFDPDLAPLVPMRLIYINKEWHGAKPAFSIVVPRPSVGQVRVVVYTAVHHANAAASGSTYYWQKQVDGQWQKTDQRINWWYEG